MQIPQKKIDVKQLKRTMKRTKTKAENVSEIVVWAAAFTQSTVAKQKKQQAAQLSE